MHENTRLAILCIFYSPYYIGYRSSNNTDVFKIMTISIMKRNTLFVKIFIDTFLWLYSQLPIFAFNRNRLHHHHFHLSLYHFVQDKKSQKSTFYPTKFNIINEPMVVLDKRCVYSRGLTYIIYEKDYQKNYDPYILTVETSIWGYVL